MSKLGDITPPEGIEDNLRDYLRRLFLQTDIALGQNNKINISGILPEKPQSGNIYYFNQVILPDILYVGFWGYVDGEWIYLGADNSVEAAYGGIIVDSTTAIPDIDATWQTVTVFDEEMLITPRGIWQVIANDALRFEFAGVYSVNINMALMHNDVNSGRSIGIRLHNDTTNVNGDAIIIGTGRNTAITNISIAGVLFELETSGENNQIQIQIGGGDAYSNVSVQSAFFSATMVSERRF